MVVVLESWPKGSALSVWGLVVFEERMRSGFDTDTNNWLAGSGRPSVPKCLVPLVPRVFLPERGGGLVGEPADPGLPGKVAVKWK